MDTKHGRLELLSAFQFPFKTARVGVLTQQRNASVALVDAVPALLFPGRNPRLLSLHAVELHRQLGGPRLLDQPIKRGIILRDVDDVGTNQDVSLAGCAASGSL